MSNRDNSGKFLPGHALPGPGRPTRAQEMATLDAIRSHFPPEKIIQMLQEAYELAVETRSARGILAVVTDVLDRTVGKPVQQPEDAKGDVLENLLRKLRAGREGYDAEGNPLRQE